MHEVPVLEFQRSSTADGTSQQFRVDGLVNLLGDGRLEY